MNVIAGIVGAGNVGQALMQGLAIEGNQQIKLLIRDKTKIPDRFQRDNIHLCKNPNDLHDVDIIVLCVKDDQIALVSESLIPFVSASTIIAHTSGVQNPEIISPYFLNRSVFYPLQSFTKGRIPNWKSIPVFIESNAESKTTLENLAQLLHATTYPIDVTLRVHLHLASVFINNFSNYNLKIAEHILESKNIPIIILQSLMQETLDKAFSMGPTESQTGPAIRDDQKTIEKHLELLNHEFPDYVQLYKDYTSLIQRK